MIVRLLARWLQSGLFDEKSARTALAPLAGRSLEHRLGRSSSRTTTVVRRPKICSMIQPRRMAGQIITHLLEQTHRPANEPAHVPSNCGRCATRSATSLAGNDQLAASRLQQPSGRVESSLIERARPSSTDARVNGRTIQWFHQRRR